LKQSLDTLIPHIDPGHAETGGKSHYSHRGGPGRKDSMENRLGMVHDE
jgi:hypothetical protein